MLNNDLLSALLDDYKNGKISKENILNTFSTQNLGFARVDHDRKARQGFAEVVYCEGKSPEQVALIVKALNTKNNNILATRASKDVFLAVKNEVNHAEYIDVARLITVHNEELEIDSSRYIVVITAGTSDIPIAEEAAVTAEMMGNVVERIFDVGVAGIHRLFENFDVIQKANVCVVIAGMDGALASVIGGLVDKPVIAVPTSVGYGANFNGLAPLLSMLNSCAAGVGVVNIDNGFGAGRLAGIINKMR